MIMRKKRFTCLSSCCPGVDRRLYCDLQPSSPLLLRSLTHQDKGLQRLIMCLSCLQMLVFLPVAPPSSSAADSRDSERLMIDRLQIRWIWSEDRWVSPGSTGGLQSSDVKTLIHEKSLYSFYSFSHQWKISSLLHHFFIILLVEP